jgi:hypothetical protein
MFVVLCLLLLLLPLHLLLLHLLLLLLLLLLLQTLSDGKPIIIEGMHLDPGLYIQDFQRRGIIMLPARPAASISPIRTARTAAATAGSPQTPQAAGFRRSLTATPRRFTAAEGAETAAAVAVAGGVPASYGSAVDGDGSVRVSLGGRSWSAGPELSARSGGSSVAAGAATDRLPALTEVDSRHGTSSSGEAQQQQQVAANLQQHEQQRKEQQQEQWQDEQQRQQQQQPGTTAANSNGWLRSTSTAQTEHQHVEQAALGSSSSTSIFPQQQQQQQQRLADESSSNPAAAGAVEPIEEAAPDGFELTAAGTLLQAAAAAAAAGSENQALAHEESKLQTPAHSRPASPSTPPAVVMLDELQVCAATAEAVALLQHRQQYQQQQQQGLGPLGSPYSSIGSEGGPTGGSPALSMEHSTTEVVSRQPSCCSPLLSQEPSAPDFSSSSVGAVGGSSTAAVLPGSMSPMTGSTSAVHRLSRSNAWQQLQPAEQLQQQQQQLQKQQQGVEPDLIAQGMLEQQLRQQEHTSSCAEQLWESANQQQQQQVEGSSEHISNGEVAAEQELIKEGVHGFHGSNEQNGALVASSVAESEGVAADLLQVLQQQGSQQLSSVSSPKQQQQQQQRRPGLPPLPPLAPQQPRSPLAARTRPEENQQQNGSYASSSAAVTKPDETATAAADAGAKVASVCSTLEVQQQQPVSLQSSKAGGEQVQRPLFVPILVYMDEADHVLMQEEALSHLGMFNSDSSIDNTTGPSQAAAAGADDVHVSSSEAAGAAAADGSGSSGECSSSSSNTAVPVSGGEALRRMRLLQEYLCAYEAQGLPVVKVTYGNFGEALDKLHEYILQCIKCAMTESGQL